MFARRPALLAGALAFAAAICTGNATATAPTPDDLTTAYRERVRQQLHPPAREVRQYADAADRMLHDAGIDLREPQYVTVVDRNPHIQALLVFWDDPVFGFRLIGASPVSTGRTGRFDHFRTPIGVFDHRLPDGDFRALGTKNELGIRGYGKKDSRVYDFGWQQAIRGWGRGGLGTMRLQMHSTDPDHLESRLGTVSSKGCIRIPSTLNAFLDHFGVLDADYEAAVKQGVKVWVLAPDRQPVVGAGRYLIVLDSKRAERPAWSPKPF
ncbi:MAG: L,D-transpeptidase [Bordetella sp.]|uniref:L,D-transpeptidase n=1 Tax=Bordetella sp. TaxID=28081 RepID=UPI003F7C2ACF